MKTLILLYWMGHLVLLQGAEMPTAPDVLGYQAWDGGLLTYAHRENLSSLYEINEETVVTGVYADGSMERFTLLQHGELPHQDGSRLINETLFLLNGEWTETSEVIEYFSSPDSITVYTCWPETGERLGGLFLELAPMAMEDR